MTFAGSWQELDSEIMLKTSDIRERLKCAEGTSFFHQMRY